MNEANGGKWMTDDRGNNVRDAGEKEMVDGLGRMMLEAFKNAEGPCRELSEALADRNGACDVIEGAIRDGYFHISADSTRQPVAYFVFRGNYFICHATKLGTFSVDVGGCWVSGMHIENDLVLKETIKKMYEDTRQNRGEKIDLRDLKLRNPFVGYLCGGGH